MYLQLLTLKHDHVAIRLRLDLKKKLLFFYTFFKYRYFDWAL